MPMTRALVVGSDFTEADILHSYYFGNVTFDEEAFSSAAMCARERTPLKSDVTELLSPLSFRAEREISDHDKARFLVAKLVLSEAEGTAPRNDNLSRGLHDALDEYRVLPVRLESKPGVEIDQTGPIDHAAAHTAFAQMA